MIDISAAHNSTGGRSGVGILLVGADDAVGAIVDCMGRSDIAALDTLDGWVDAFVSVRNRDRVRAIVRAVRSDGLARSVVVDGSSPLWEGHLQIEISRFMADGEYIAIQWRGQAAEQQTPTLHEYRRYRQLVETASDIIYEADVNGRITFANEVASRYASLPIDSIIGRHFSDFVSASCRKDVVAFYANQVEQSIPTSYYEFKAWTGSGEEFWVGQNVRLVFDDDHRPVAVQAVARDINERKQAEENLRASEEKYSNLFHNLMDAVIVHDLEGHILDLNSRALDQFGYTRDEMLALCVLDLHPPERSPDARAAFQRIRKDGRVAFEVEFLRKNGSVFSAEVSATLLQIGNDAVIQGVVKDVTDRQRAAMAVRSSEERYRALYDNIPTMYFTVDSSGTVLSVNPFAVQHLGYSRDELIGTPVLDVFHVDDRAEVQSKIEECLLNPIPWSSWEFRKIRKDGRVIWVRESVQPVQGQDGQTVFHIICEDITEQKLAEEKLRESEMRKSAILEAALDCVISLDEDGLIVDFNPAAKVTFGYDVDQAIGTHFSELIVQPSLSASFKDNRFLRRRVELLARRKDGTHFQVEAAIVPVRCGGRKLYTAYLRDITERKQAEEAFIQAHALAEQSTRAKEQFLANMSHEMRTPLNAIIGMTHLMMQSPSDDERGRYLDAIKNSADNLLVLINDILDFAKIESGNIRFEAVPFKVRELLTSVIDSISVLAESKGLDVQLAVDDTLPEWLVGDPIRLNQVLLNLLTNAIKFTEDGRVVVSVEEAEPDGMPAGSLPLRLSVRDTGIGIDADDLPKIFSSFTQARSDTSRKYGGTGLGLAIVKELVERQLGRVEADSEPGRGSCFSVIVPYQVADEGVVATFPVEADERVAYDLSGTRILVIEDNELNKLVARTMLEQWGATVVTASTGMEAIEILRDSDDFDLALMDIQMPELDGYESSRRIRNDLGISNQRLPIVALTASALVDHRDDVLAAGMDDFLLKPFDPDELRHRIGRLLGLAKAHTSSGDGHQKSVVLADPSENVDGRPRFRGELVNLAYIEANSFGNHAFILRVIDVFQRQLPSYLQGMENAIDENAYERLSFLAHKMRSSASMLGIQQLTDALRGIEEGVTVDHNAGALVDQVNRARTVALAANEELEVARSAYDVK